MTRVIPVTELGRVLRASADEFPDGLEGLADELGLTARTLNNIMHGHPVTVTTLEIVAAYLLPEEQLEKAVGTMLAWHRVRSIG